MLNIFCKTIIISCFLLLISICSKTIPIDLSGQWYTETIDESIQIKFEGILKLKLTGRNADGLQFYIAESTTGQSFWNCTFDGVSLHGTYETKGIQGKISLNLSSDKKALQGFWQYKNKTGVFKAYKK